MIPNNIPIYEKKLSDKPSPIQDERPLLQDSSFLTT